MSKESLTPQLALLGPIERIPDFIRVETEEFAKDLVGRQEALLTSFNANSKSVVFLLLPSDSSISFGDLSRKFDDIYRVTQFEGVDHSTILSYLNYFHKVGLIERSRLSGAGTRKSILFSLTKAGREFGRPIAALELFFEFNRRLSIFSVLGTTNKGSTARHTAPYHRAVILRYLVQKETSTREVELVKVLGIPDEIVSRSLGVLAKAGVIEYSEAKRLAFSRINQVGKIFDSEFLEPIFGLIAGDDRFRDWINSEILPKVSSELSVFAQEDLPLYYSYSHSFKMRQFRQNRARILALISQSPEGKSTKELANSVHLTPSSINRILLPYVRHQQIIVQVNRGENYYIFSRQL